MISYLLEQEIYKSFIIQCKNIKELYWKTSQPLPLFPGASTCFSQLHKLNINLDYVNSNSLQEMAKYCKSLNELSVRNPKDSTGLISLIDAQKNLKEIFLYSIKFRERTYEKLIDEQDDDIKKIKEFQRCLAISEFPNLQFLSIYWLLSFKELAKLIEKTNENLLHLDIYNTHRNVKNTGMLIISIANNCPKIKTLRTYIEPKDFIYVKSLLLNCKYLEVVKFDSLYAFINLNDNILGDELLNILAEFSPKFLTNITISAIWKYSIDGFIRLFESYKERNLRHFNLCKNYDYDITEDHKVIIKKYIDEGIIRNSTCTFY
ncbi:23155_t:CDS:2 [Rhizophagus irregularis]|nr:23155_t:CDS:2 [Rhizophagus irregularis]